MIFPPSGGVCTPKESIGYGDYDIGLARRFLGLRACGARIEKPGQLVIMLSRQPTGRASLPFFTGLVW
jgi:hypothetical protein